MRVLKHRLTLLVPYDHAAVSTTRRKALAVPVEGHAVNSVFMRAEGHEEVAIRRVVQEYTRADGNDHLSAGRVEIEVIDGRLLSILGRLAGS